MIAATDPQEFVPGGRQLISRHPGPLETHSCLEGEALLQKLKNISISDDHNKEWWTVRSCPVFETISNENKSATDSYTEKSFINVESNKTQRSDYSDDSWSIKSENIRNYGQRRLSDVNASKIMHKRFSVDNDFFRPESRSSCHTYKSFCSNSKFKKQNLSNKSTHTFLEEELYVKGNTAVWSNGIIQNDEETTECRKVMCCYTMPAPIIQALWCTFHLDMPIMDLSMLDIKEKFEERLDKLLPSICLMDSQNIKAFVIGEEDFIISPPFAVKKLWSCKFGILLERNINALCKEEKCMEGAPTLFSLGHPLDDVRPVAIGNDVIHIAEEKNLQIVFTSEEPSLCIIYNATTGQHNVYQIKKARRDQWNDYYQKNISYTSLLSTCTKGRSKTSMYDGQKSILSQILSPFNSRANSAASMTSQRCVSSLATMSRCQSPVLSPVPSTSQMIKTSKMHSSMRLEHNVSVLAETTCNINSTTNNFGLSPAICLEHLWVDNVLPAMDTTGNNAASKVFLSQDLTGQSYLCYFVPAKLQLNLVKFDRNSFTFGMATSMSARDAIGIPSLHMIAILDHSSNIILYSGLSLVGKLHIGGVLAEHIPSPCITRHNILQFTSPYPKRSSLLPQCATPTADPKFDDHLLSPVLPPGRNVLQFQFKSDMEGDHKCHLNGLRDAVGEKLTLQYSDGTFYRTTLPNLTSSPIVENCLNALRQTLPREALITLLTRWYSARNAPGPTDYSTQKEWSMFTSLMFDLLGYEEDHSSDNHTEQFSPTCSAKRQRPMSRSSDLDWDFMVKHKRHTNVVCDINSILNFKKPIVDVNYNVKHKATPINTKAVLFPFMRIIHFTLHLLNEDLKLDLYKCTDPPLLAEFLSKISVDLGLMDYYLYYWKDFPDRSVVVEKNYSSYIKTQDLKGIMSWSVIKDEPESIVTFLEKLIEGCDVKPYPHIHAVNDRSKDILELCGMYIQGTLLPHKDIYRDTLTKTLMPLGSKMDVLSTPKSNIIYSSNQSIAEKVVLRIAELGITPRDMDSYPISIKLLLNDALYHCRQNPPSDWSTAAYNLLQRNDLAAQMTLLEKDKIENSLNLSAQSNIQDFSTTIKPKDTEQEDGMDDIESPLLKLRFSEDLRVAEVRRLLQSTKPVQIVLLQRPDVSDHDFIEEQEKHLYAICTRTMALPVGRGMFTMRTINPVITEPLATPSLCLTGKAPPRGSTVELTHIDTPTNMNSWPLFHNGVANGLRVTSEADNINSSWITFNKPKNNNDSPMEHAGFLMGLGLNGHLKNLSVFNTFDYLAKANEMTSVGVLLGLATAFRGTANQNLTKMISLHVEGLLPPTSMELDVPQNLQVAALLSIGLLYQNTAHRHMTEVLLTEIGRPPGPEMENSVDRQSYSLAAGLALGLVTLRQGGRSSGLQDLNIPDILHYYMVGGNKRPLSGSQKDKYKVPSFQIKEGSCVNLDVTAPGATLALGLMYLGSGNKAVADWMAPPATQYLLDFVRPDFLMLRTLSRGLILWDYIEPDKDWVLKQVPATIRPYCMVTPDNSLDIDYEAMNQAYCNIVAGACFAMGLKFAGSANPSAFETLLEFCHMFTSLTSKSIAELAGKPTIETCLNVVLLSVSMVMAGSGNVEIMRIVRHLRRRVGVASSAIVTYGSHLAIHMSLGLLFLGGGRYTLSNSPSSIAALICAFYPKFPTHSNDNRYHLQAFRHLYVLAVEARLLIPKDVMSGKMCYATLNIVKIDGTSFKTMAPAQLPDLNSLYKVSVEDERYWNVVFERGRNWDQLVKILNHQGCIEVKQRVGYLSYLEDKTGLRIELAHTITKSLPWEPPAKAINSFSSDLTIRHFVNQFLVPYFNRRYPEKEKEINQFFIKTSYEAVVQDKVFIIPIFCSYFLALENLRSSPNNLVLQQLKLSCLYSNVFLDSPIISTETLLSLKTVAIQILFNSQKEHPVNLSSYLESEIPNVDAYSLKRLAAYTLLFDVPFELNQVFEYTLEFIVKLQSKGFRAENLSNILSICFRN